MNGHSVYAEVQSISTQNLVAANAPLVKKIAYHLRNRLPDHIQLDDLIQAGMIGLLEASNHFDASLGASFDTFAGIRIRGAMLDEIRKLDWTPRSVYRKARAVSEAIQQLEKQTGRDPSDSEIARQMGVSLEEYHRVLMDNDLTRLYSVEEMEESGGENQFAQSSEPSPETRLLEEDQQSSLVSAIAQLPEKEQLVMSLYYQEELNFREIGEVLSVSESRVCQIHGQAVHRIRSKLNKNSD